MPELVAFGVIVAALGAVAVATEWFEYGDGERQAAAPTAPIARAIAPGQQPQLAEAVRRAESSSHRSAAQPGRAGWQWRSDGAAPQTPVR